MEILKYFSFKEFFVIEISFVFVIMILEFKIEKKIVSVIFELVILSYYGFILGKVDGEDRIFTVRFG